MLVVCVWSAVKNLIYQSANGVRIVLREGELRGGDTARVKRKLGYVYAVMHL